jgi:hypothetical protein
MKEGATEVKVTGSCDLAINGDTVTVSGETDMMPGALVYVSVESQDGFTLSSAKLNLGEDGKISQDFTMSADKYDDTVTAVMGHITCASHLYGAQPAGAYEKYGDKFENIALSDNLIWNSKGCFVVFASEMVELGK